MAVQVTSVQCPNCGGSVDIDQKRCEYCGNAVMISSFSAVAAIPQVAFNNQFRSYRQALAECPDNTDLSISVAMCFLRLRQFDHALNAFEKAMPSNFDNSEVFFYAAVCLLQGKMPFLHMRPTIDKILSYLDSALMIEDRGIYHYFLAYIKHDYFKRKFLNVTPNFSQHLEQAKRSGVLEDDIQQLFQLIGTQRPAGL